MVNLTKKEAKIIADNLHNIHNKEIKRIVKKLTFPQKKRIYICDKAQIIRVLQKAFNEKRKVKISYYSPHNDENTIRVVDIYQIYKGVITCFCHLRDEERNFLIDRINSATLLDKKYKIPNGWSPESIIL